MKHKSNYQHCDFFVLRNPLLSYNQMNRLFTNDVMAIVDNHISMSEKDYKYSYDVSAKYLLSQLNDKVIREALWLASPDLVGRFSNETFVENNSRRLDTLVTLYKYYVRMAARCTPFALFASCTFGRISEQTEFKVTTPTTVNRVTRLDMEYLYRLVATLNADNNLRKSFRYSRNTSLYPAGTQLHYAEARMLPDKKGITYKLSAVDVTDYLVATLSRAESAVSVSALAESLSYNDPDITAEDATEYIKELIDNQLLVPEITPPVTGEPSLPAILRELGNAHETSLISTVLNRVNIALQEIDSAGLGVDLRHYQTAIEELRKLPAKVDEKHLFQVDANIQFPIQLSQNLADEIRIGVELLHSISPPLPQGILDRFKSDFRERYEDQEIPLCEVLDDDIGIGFDDSNNSGSMMEPLLSDIPVFNTGPSSQMTVTPRELCLIDKIQKLTRHKQTEMTLDGDLIKSLTNENPKPLPDAWSAFVMLFGSSSSDDSDYHFLLKSVIGPGAANLLGRFCHLNAEFDGAVKLCMHAEELINTEAMYAEIAHMPGGRVGNVLQRPVLRNYEIVYLGKSGAPKERQIGVQDLIVSVKADRIILKSKRTGKEILPRLASAHSYSNPANLRIYRFLCFLQQQGVHGALSWSWGALNALSFLPRVTHDHMILERASWKLDIENVKSLAKLSDFRQFKAIQELRERFALPRWVSVAEADNEIPFDLNCPLSVAVLCRELYKYKSAIRLHEVLSEQFGTPLTINGESYANELLIPFVRRVH